MYLYHYAIRTDTNVASSTVEINKRIKSNNDFTEFVNEIRILHDLEKEDSFCVTSVTLLHHD